MAQNKKLIKSEIEAFIGKYTLTSETRGIVKIDTSNAFDTNAEIAMHTSRCIVFAEMVRLHMKHPVDVTIVSKPQQIVYASRAYAVGALKIVIVPTAPNALATDANKGQFVVKHIETNRKFYYNLKATKEIVAVAAWVSTSPTKAGANLEIGQIVNQIIDVPILTNSKPIKKGDALVRYVPPKKKAEKEVDRAMPVSKAAKLL